MKKILILISKATVLILLLSLSSCYYDEEVVIPKVVLEPVEDVSFETQIQPIFDLKIDGTSCADCHNGNIAPDLTKDNSYQAIINGYIVPNNLDDSKLYQTLITTDASKLMPPNGGVSIEDINLVKSWIEQGAKDN